MVEENTTSVVKAVSTYKLSVTAVQETLQLQRGDDGLWNVKPPLNDLSKAVCAVVVVADELARGQKDVDTENPFSHFTGDLSHWTFSEEKKTVNFTRAFADVVGFTSDPSPWSTRITSTVGAETMLLGAWDVSAGALLLRRELLQKSARWHPWMNQVRRTWRRTVGALSRSVRRRSRGDGSVRHQHTIKFIHLYDACRLALDALGMPANYDPYGLLPHQSTTSASASAIEYAWFVFATLRNALTRGAAVMRPATVLGTAARDVSLLAHLFNCMLYLTKKTKTSADAWSSAFRSFCTHTRELRFPDIWRIFSPPNDDAKLLQLGWVRVSGSCGDGDANRPPVLVAIVDPEADDNHFRSLVRDLAGIQEAPAKTESEAVKKTAGLHAYTHGIDALATTTKEKEKEEEKLQALINAATWAGLSTALECEMRIRLHALHSLRVARIKQPELKAVLAFYVDVIRRIPLAVEKQTSEKELIYAELAKLPQLYMRPDGGWEYIKQHVNTIAEHPEALAEIVNQTTDEARKLQLAMFFIIGGDELPPAIQVLKSRVQKYIVRLQIQALVQELRASTASATDKLQLFGQLTAITTDAEIVTREANDLVASLLKDRNAYDDVLWLLTHGSHTGDKYKRRAYALQLQNVFAHASPSESEDYVKLASTVTRTIADTEDAAPLQPKAEAEDKLADGELYDGSKMLPKPRDVPAIKAYLPMTYLDMHAFASGDAAELTKTEETIDGVAQRCVNILVVGRPKRGKSNFINFLFNREILESNSDPGYSTLQVSVVKGLLTFHTQSLVARVFDTPGIDEGEHPLADLFKMFQANGITFDVVFFLFSARVDSVVRSDLRDLIKYVNVSQVACITTQHRGTSDGESPELRDNIMMDNGPDIAFCTTVNFKTNSPTAGDTIRMGLHNIESALTKILSTTVNLGESSTVKILPATQAPANSEQTDNRGELSTVKILPAPANSDQTVNREEPSTVKIIPATPAVSSQRRVDTGAMRTRRRGRVNAEVGAMGTRRRAVALEYMNPRTPADTRKLTDIWEMPEPLTPAQEGALQAAAEGVLQVVVPKSAVEDVLQAVDPKSAVEDVQQVVDPKSAVEDVLQVVDPEVTRRQHAENLIAMLLARGHDAIARYGDRTFLMRGIVEAIHLLYPDPRTRPQMVSHLLTSALVAAPESEILRPLYEQLKTFERSALKNHAKIDAFADEILHSILLIGSFRVVLRRVEQDPWVADKLRSVIERVETQKGKSTDARVQLIQSAIQKYTVATHAVPIPEATVTPTTTTTT